MSMPVLDRGRCSARGSLSRHGPSRVFGSARLAQALCLLALIGSICAVAVLAVAYARSSAIALGGQEQNVIFGVQSLLNGHALYRDPVKFPFVIAQYTPVFYELCFIVCRVLGAGSRDIHEIYIVARLISAVASIGSCAIIYQILARYAGLGLTIRLVLAIAFPLAIGHWAYNARPDAVYVFFVVTSLWASMLYAEHGRRVMLVISAVLLVAAYYSKQSALLMLPLPFVVSFARSGWKAFKPPDLALCAAVFSAGGILMSAAMLRNFSVGLQNGFDVSWAIWNVYVPVLRLHLLLIVAAAMGMGSAFLTGAWAPRSIGLATLWFLATGAGLSLKFGSADNYLTEFIAGCLLCIGMSPYLARVDSGDRLSLGTVLTIGLVLVADANAMYRSRPGLQSSLTSREDLYRTGALLRSDPELLGQSVLDLDFNSFVFIPDQTVMVPLEVYGSSAAAGHFDLSLVTNAVRAGQICFAVSEPRLLAGLSGSAPAEDWNAWMRSVGPEMLAGFHAVRDIGSKVLLRSQYCSRQTP